MTTDAHDPVAHGDDIPETERFVGAHYGAAFKPLTPSMKAHGGRLGINRMRVPRGRSVCPFHSHTRSATTPTPAR